MAFQLENVVPWGRTLNEYKDMFALIEEDLKGRIGGFGDGPASFNYELKNMQGTVYSFDPLYQFSSAQVEQRIYETKDIVMKQVSENKGNYVWTTIGDLKQLEQMRMGAMKMFLEDYELGVKEGRYIYHELPGRMNYSEDYFDLGLSSHFLLMYTELGEDFHKQAIQEMLRVCKEVRIFPVVDLDGNATALTKVIIDYFSQYYMVELVDVVYHFQKNANKMLKITKT